MRTNPRYVRICTRTYSNVNVTYNVTYSNVAAKLGIAHGALHAVGGGGGGDFSGNKIGR